MLRFLALSILLVCQTAQAVEPPSYVLEWGIPGSMPGEFLAIQGVAVDDVGFVYVVDQSNHRVQKFTASGVFVTQWGTFGSQPGNLTYPTGIAHRAGEIYVVDHSNHRIQVFDKAGSVLRGFGNVPGPGFLSYPIDVAVDTDGFVYVSDEGDGQFSPLDDTVKKYASDGTFVMNWGVPTRAFGIHTSDGRVYVGGNVIAVHATDGVFQGTIGSVGSAPGQFRLAAHIARDPAGNFYVGDNGNHRVQMFDASFQFLTQWGEQGSAPGQFVRPNFLAIDAAGDIYVSDNGNSRIQKFAFAPVAARLTDWSQFKRAYR
jgi:streptogramin lyase